MSAEMDVEGLVKRLGEMAPQASHYGAWAGGVLMEQAAAAIESLTRQLRAAQEELAAIKRQAEDSTEYVLASMYREAVEKRESWVYAEANMRGHLQAIVDAQNAAELYRRMREARAALTERSKS